MKVILNSENVVVAKHENIEIVNNKIYIPEIDTYYIDEGLKVIHTNLDPRVQQDKLVDEKIEANLSYREIEE
jgi:hypothetical protein